ncbi:MAG: type II toxin-antitoxin system prevent-host-death family antitoxin [Caldilineaceae bacterium]
MEKVQQIEPISTMQLRPAEVLAKLENGPVILAQRSKPVAVVVSVALWDRIAAYVEDLEDALDAAKAELELANGEDETVTLTETEIQAWLGEDEKVSA